jgi:hypothetical protein
MYVVSFEGYFLTPRYDGKKWTQARIEEAPAEDGPWTILETQAIADYPTASNPPVQNFTTELGTLLEGWYRITFLDATGDTEQPTLPLLKAQEPQQQFTPSVSQVANWIRARTKNSYGVEIGTFTDDTRPTDEQAMAEIASATSDVVMFVDDDIPEEAWPLAQEVASLGAACRIELSYFPEQVGTDRSAYDRLKTYYDEMLLRLQEAVSREELEEEGDVSHGVYYYFPEPEPNWDTVIF